MGYTAFNTQATRDGGVDVILQSADGATLVQCKAHQKRIGVKAFRELYGVMVDRKAHAGKMVCLKGATVDAMRFIRDKKIEVVDISDLVSMSKQLALKSWDNP